MTVTQRGASVFVAGCTRRVVLRRLGDGFRPSAPAGSTCDGETSYTLDFDDDTLTWSVCNFGVAGAPFTLDAGMRSLSATEVSAARTALEQVTVWVTVIGIVSDIPTSTIEVTQANQTQRYVTSLLAYRETPGTLYVDNLEEVFTAFAELAHE